MSIRFKYGPKPWTKVGFEILGCIAIAIVIATTLGEATAGALSRIAKIQTVIGMSMMISVVPVSIQIAKKEILTNLDYAIVIVMLAGGAVISGATPYMGW